MKIVHWDIQFLSPPPAIKYCKKCGKKMEHICSGLFRVNAQRKYLDIWLIYKCSDCDSTWNMTIYSRIKSNSIAPDILEGFHSNNQELVGKYSMDTELITRSGAEAGVPVYKISGPDIDLTHPVELHIKSPHPSRLKVSTIIREKLNLSQNAFEQMITNGLIQSNNTQDIKKYRVQTEAILLINNENRPALA